MFTQPATLTIELPDWVADFARTYAESADIDARMAFVIAASKRSIEEETGGPFAAAVFERETGRLVSLGVNLVTSGNLSVLHAEIVAMSLAQSRLKTYDLGAVHVAQHELFASTEPCSMCLGAIPWSGICRVVTAARDEDARRIGFDEGPKPGNWECSLQERGIEVISNIDREAARSVLDLYKERGRPVYNSRAGQQTEV